MLFCSKTAAHTFSIAILYITISLKNNFNNPRDPLAVIPRPRWVYKQSLSYSSLSIFGVFGHCYSGHSLFMEQFCSNLTGWVSWYVMISTFRYNLYTYLSYAPSLLAMLVTWYMTANNCKLSFSFSFLFSPWISIDRLIPLILRC